MDTDEHSAAEPQPKPGGFVLVPSSLKLAHRARGRGRGRARETCALQMDTDEQKGREIDELCRQRCRKLCRNRWGWGSGVRVLFCEREAKAWVPGGGAGESGQRIKPDQTKSNQIGPTVEEAPLKADPGQNNSWLATGEGPEADLPPGLKRRPLSALPFGRGRIPLAALEGTKP